jgi:hypothetical protein
MPNLLVTHSDEPLGRRVVKLLWHDGRVGRIFGLGSGAAPRAFDAFRAGSSPRLAYARIDLAKHRPMSDFFHSKLFREFEIDTVIHVPRHGVGSEGPPVAGNVSPRAAEARLVLQHTLATASIRSLVAVGSAFVYRLAPGNANHLSESSELDLEPDAAPGLRPWIDCDMLFHGEIGNPRLRVALLRLPTVVASGGYVYLHPGLAGRAGPRLRPLGSTPTPQGSSTWPDAKRFLSRCWGAGRVARASPYPDWSCGPPPRARADSYENRFAVISTDRTSATDSRSTRAAPSASSAFARSTR